jgi:hypothetical protein
VQCASAAVPSKRCTMMEITSQLFPTCTPSRYVHVDTPEISRSAKTLAKDTTAVSWGGSYCIQLTQRLLFPPGHPRKLLGRYPVINAMPLEYCSLQHTIAPCAILRQSVIVFDFDVQRTSLLGQTIASLHKKRVHGFVRSHASTSRANSRTSTL